MSNVRIVYRNPPNAQAAAIRRGLPGVDGKSAYELAVASGYEGTVGEWLLSLKGLDVELGVSDTHFQWRHAGDDTWNDLLSIESVTGLDGREIEVGVSGAVLQWRYVGDSGWNSLLDFSALVFAGDDPNADSALILKGISSPAIPEEGILVPRSGELEGYAAWILTLDDFEWRITNMGVGIDVWEVQRIDLADSLPDYFAEVASDAPTPVGLTGWWVINGSGQPVISANVLTGSFIGQRLKSNTGFWTWDGDAWVKDGGAPNWDEIEGKPSLALTARTDGVPDAIIPANADTTLQNLGGGTDAGIPIFKATTKVDAATAAGLGTGDSPTFAGVTLNIDGSIVSPALQFGESSVNGLYRSGNGVVGMSISGAARYLFGNGVGGVGLRIIGGGQSLQFGTDLSVNRISGSLLGIGSGASGTSDGDITLRNLTASGTLSVTGASTLAAYSETVVALGTVAATATLAITAGTVITATLTASTECTFTMPTAAAGKSFILHLKQAATPTTAIFTGVIWSGGAAYAATQTAGRVDIISFATTPNAAGDGWLWVGSVISNHTLPT